MTFGQLTSYRTKLVCDRFIGTDRVLTDQDFPDIELPPVAAPAPALALVADADDDLF